MNRNVLSLWFIRLRWFAFVGQLFILTTAIAFFKLTLPWMEIVGIVSLIPLSNILARTRFAVGLPERNLVGYLLALDTLLLTATLYEAGGPTNPFTIVYLLHVVLASIMLTPVWTWVIAILSSLGFGALFVHSLPIPEWATHGAHQGFSLHLHGMLFTYWTVALLVTYFLNKIVGELRRKERKLERFENVIANQQKLASLATIAASAAHELGTPLSTIDVISHELGRMIERRYPDKDLLEDIGLLKNETARCKTILRGLSERTGDLIGESPQPSTVSELIESAMSPLSPQPVVTIQGSVNMLMPSVPKKALTLALRSILQNALDASDGSQRPIEIYATDKGNDMFLEVKDYGVGMDEQTLERIGEPFFSKKAKGEGMGLGIYLSKLTAEQLGGSLDFTSFSGQGTTARLRFPLDCSFVDGTT